MYALFLNITQPLGLPTSNIDTIERVQRRFTKRLPGFEIRHWFLIHILGQLLVQLAAFLSCHYYISVLAAVLLHWQNK